MMPQSKSLNAYLIGFWLTTMSLVIIFSSCSPKSSEENPSTDQGTLEVRPEMIFDIADDKSVDFSIETQGIVKPTQELPIQMRVSGYLQSHKITDGMRVRTSEVIIQLDETEFDLHLAEAEAGLDKAMRNYEIEKRSREQRGLGLNEAQDRQLKNQYGVTNAELALERARLNASYTRFTAPFDGYISTQEILTEGMMISSGTSYGIIVDQAEVSVRFEVLAIEINRVKTGMKVEVDVPGSAMITCRISSVSPIVDDKSRTGQVTARCGNPGALLKRGMTVNGRISIDSAKGKTRLPRAAVLDRDQRKVVFKLKGDRLEWIYVEPVAMTAEWVIIDHEQIAPGDTIAVDRHFTASHDLRVTPRMRLQPVSEIR
jgi:RND family efflux transporter MFP subunit